MFKKMFTKLFTTLFEQVLNKMFTKLFKNVQQKWGSPRPPEIDELPFYLIAPPWGDDRRPFIRKSRFGSHLGSQSQPKRHPKSTQKGPRTDFDRSSIETHIPKRHRGPAPPFFGAHGGPSWEPKCAKNQSKIDFKCNHFCNHFWDRFRSPVGADLVRFGNP